MTSYGEGRAAEGGLRVAVELRSVNNRYLDLNIRTPRALFPYESELRELLQRRIARGRVMLVVGEEWTGDQVPAVRLDTNRARQYARQLQELQRELGLAGEVRLEHLLALDNLLLPAEETSYREFLWTLTRRALEEALTAFDAAARREGEVLVADMRRRIAAVRESLDLIREMAKAQVA
jgi:uncharacterized protein (TIGR00255 family)